MLLVAPTRLFGSGTTILKSIQQFELGGKKQYVK